MGKLGFEGFFGSENGQKWANWGFRAFLGPKMDRNGQIGPKNGQKLTNFRVLGLIFGPKMPRNGQIGV